MIGTVLSTQTQLVQCCKVVVNSQKFAFVNAGSEANDRFENVCLGFAGSYVEMLCENNVVYFILEMPRPRLFSATRKRAVSFGSRDLNNYSNIFIIY